MCIVSSRFLFRDMSTTVFLPFSGLLYVFLMSCVISPLDIISLLVTYVVVVQSLSHVRLFVTLNT